MAICKSQNGESGNGMKVVMGMRGIRVGMQEIGVGMWGMRRMWGTGGNVGNQGGNAGNKGWNVERDRNKRK